MKNNDIVTEFKLNLALKLESLKDQIQLNYEKEIESLKRIERTTNVYDIDGERFSSARGVTELNEGDSFTAKEFKEELEKLGIIKREIILSPKWIATDKGIELGLVSSDKHHTAIYNVKKATDLFKQVKVLEDE